MDELIRCKFFNDEGAPIGDGCRFGARCRFIHPSDPIWKTTMPYRARKTSDRFKDDGPGRHVDSGYPGWASRDQSYRGDSYAQHDRESSSNRGGRGRGHAKNRSSGGSWSKASGDSSNWNSYDSRPLTSKSVENPTPTPTQGAWGAADTSGGASTQDSMDSSGWTSSNWGESANTAWGEGTAWGGASADWASGGWGGDTVQQSNTVKANEPNPASSNQPTPNSPSILSTSPAISRLPQSSDQQEAVVNRLLSPSKLASDRSTVSITPRDVEMKEATASVMPSTRAPITAKRPRLPLPTRIKLAPSPTTPIHDSPTDTKQLPPPSPVVPQDWTRIPLSGSITGRVQQDDVTSDASGSITTPIALDPKELHSRFVKEMMQAVITRYDLLRAEERKDIWRKTRHSSCYHHSTPAAQKILESTKHKYSEEITKLNKSLNSTLKRIVSYSDGLNAHRDLVKKGVDKKKIRVYTDELRDWVVNLDLSKRVSTAAAIMDQEKMERETIKRNKKEQVIALKNAVYELELRVTDICDDLHHMQSTQPEYFQEAFLVMEKAMEEENPDNLPDLEKMFSELGVGGDVVTKVKERIETMDQKILDHLPKVEDLKGHIKALEMEVADLRQRGLEIAEFHKEASTKLEQVEMWKTEDKARLDQLSRRIEDLNQYPCPLPLTHQHPPPIKIDDLAPYINELITEYVTREIKPALDAIVNAVDVDGQQFTSEFNKLVEGVVMKTYDLVQMALKADGLVPRLGPITM